MNRFLLISACGLFMSIASYGAGKTALSRGGLGIIFTDHNSFSNAGQFALDKGMALEAQYAQMTVLGQSMMVAQPSFVFGNGSFGLGVYGNRTAASISDSTGKTDTVGAGLGFSMAKERVTLGISGERNLEDTATNDGTVGATLTLNGNKRMGFSLTAGVDMTLNDVNGDTKSAKAGLGWGFTSNTSAEVYASWDSIDDFDDMDITGVLTSSTQKFYGSAAFTYAKASEAMSVSGRVGVVLGRFDLSGTIIYSLEDGIDPIYGGSARIAF